MHPTTPVYESVPIVGRSKIYKSIKVIENGWPRRTVALERPIMRRIVCGDVGQQAEER